MSVLPDYWGRRRFEINALYHSHGHLSAKVSVFIDMRVDRLHKKATPHSLTGVYDAIPYAWRPSRSVVASDLIARCPR